MKRTGKETAPHIATLVGASASTALKDEFAHTLANETGSDITIDELCPYGDDFAFDAPLPSISAQSAIALQKVLEKSVGQQGDVAVLPAEGRRKRLLVSDMDSTIITAECLDELADFAGKKREVSAITERAMAGELNFEAALTERVAMLAGLPLSELQACFDSRIELTPGASELVHHMKQAGSRTVLVSGGFTFFTERVAAAAGFDAHRGNTLLNENDRLTGEVGQPILGREAKLTALEEEAKDLGVGLEDSLTLGDGANDLAMIQASGLGIAYRAKPIVAAEARCAINHTSLRTALYFQGYRAGEFAG